MDRRPQREQKHPDEYQRDLNPEHMAGQNIGKESVEPEQSGHTAYHLKEMHRRRADFSDDDLKQIPVVPEGTRLRQGATYLDLDDRERGEFTATGDMEASPGDAYVPKGQTPFPIWNRLAGVENPDRL